jgi:exosome complex component RRP4
MSSTTTSRHHLVFPGQVIAVSDPNGGSDDSFLRGHGTYVVSPTNSTGQQQQQRLIASIAGTVQRVNKLVSVESTAVGVYCPQVGDLCVGRIASVGTGRWNVQLLGNSSTSRTAVLPITGVHLSGGVQRVRTAQDAREMRHFLQEGDLVSAEVHNVQPGDGTIYLQTRSHKFGRLENGYIVTVPPGLVPRRKNHVWTFTVDALPF